MNQLAHFLLAHRLLNHLIQNGPSRIVVTSSVAHLWVANDSRWDDFYSSSGRYREDDPNWYGIGQYQLDIYSRTKLWNVMFADELAEKLHGTNVTVNSLYPGDQIYWNTVPQSLGFFSLGNHFADLNDVLLNYEYYHEQTLSNLYGHVLVRNHSIFLKISFAHNYF